MKSFCRGEQYTTKKSWNYRLNFIDKNKQVGKFELSTNFKILIIDKFYQQIYYQRKKIVDKFIGDTYFIYRKNNLSVNPQVKKVTNFSPMSFHLLYRIGLNPHLHHIHKPSTLDHVTVAFTTIDHYCRCNHLRCCRLEALPTTFLSSSSHYSCMGRLFFILFLVKGSNKFTKVPFQPASL